MSSSSLDRAFEAFLDSYPGYRETTALDELRAREFARLDELGQVYLDYTGSGLYAASLVRRHADDLLGGVFGNPHSINPASVASSERIARCRERILRFFRADPAEYAVVFTSNASQALKLVGESYPFHRGDTFLLTFDNHNSVNGIREYDRASGATTTYVPMVPPDLRVDEAALQASLAAEVPGLHKLFAFPAQSNFSGVLHPLEWVESAHRRGWDVLLDAAAFVPTHRLDLGRVKPEFVALSFYKMFGYPTGVGVLIAKHTALERLHRPWFAGGTINVASVQADRFVFAAGPVAFEDGTLDFTNIPAVTLGLDLLESVGYDLLCSRLDMLTSWMLREMLALAHSNGEPLVRIYGPGGTEGRGATVAFNFYDREGRTISHRSVEELAAREGISLRTGCFCNPGAGELALGISRPQLESCFAGPGMRMTYDDLRRCIDPHAAGAVRVSLGLASNFADVARFIEWARGFLG